MKKLIIKLKNKIGIVAAACALVLTPKAGAQIVFQMTSISNNIYAPIQSSFVTITNPVSQFLQQHSIMVTNINTNESIWVAYAFQLNGTTNLYVASPFLTNFPASNGLVNGSTWIYTFPQTTISGSTTPWGMFSNGPPTGACPFTNGVIFN